MVTFDTTNMLYNICIKHILYYRGGQKSRPNKNKSFKIFAGFGVSNRLFLNEVSNYEKFLDSAIFDF